MLFFPFVEVRTDVLESLGGLGNFLSLDFGFFFISLLLEPVSKDIEQFKLDSRADL